MKKSSIIICFITISLLSCTRNDDRNYKRIVKEIHFWENKTKYDYPVFDYIKELDSINQLILKDYPELNADKLADLEMFTSTKSITDSIKSEIRKLLTETEENNTPKSIKQKIKRVRYLYSNEVLSYIKRVENDSSYSSLLLHRYSISDHDSIFRCFDVFIPTGDVLEIYGFKKVRYHNLDHKGISIQFNDDYDRKDTIGIKLKWYDNKLNDTLTSIILQTKN